MHADPNPDDDREQDRDDGSQDHENDKQGDGSNPFEELFGSDEMPDISEVMGKLPDMGEMLNTLFGTGTPQDPVRSAVLDQLTQQKTTEIRELLNDPKLTTAIDDFTSKLSEEMPKFMDGMVKELEGDDGPSFNPLEGTPYGEKEFGFPTPENLMKMLGGVLDSSMAKDMFANSLAGQFYGVEGPLAKVMNTFKNFTEKMEAAIEGEDAQTKEKKEDSSSASAAKDTQFSKVRDSFVEKLVEIAKQEGFEKAFTPETQGEVMRGLVASAAEYREIRLEHLRFADDVIAEKRQKIREMVESNSAEIPSAVVELLNNTQGTLDEHMIYLKKLIIDSEIDRYYPASG